MNREASELLKKALSLPPKARAALASSLLESLDDHVESTAEGESNLEIARQILQLDSRKVRTAPSKARRQVLSRLTNWSEYLAEERVASPAFMDYVEDLPAPRRKRQR